MTAKTGEASTVHEPIGSPSGPGLWHHKGLQLPAYIQHVAHHLIAQGRSESEAIQEAVGIVKNWAEGHDGHGHQVHPDVQAAASKNIAEWEALKAKAHGSGKARRSTVTVTQRAQMTAASIDNLPDSDFAYIEPGGSKDSSGRTVPRSLRHFPVHDAAHVRDALSRAPDSPFGSNAMPKIRQAAKKFGIDSGDDSGSASRAEQRQELFRTYGLEDAHIVRTGEGDSSGRVVEAYCAVFDEATEIRDHEGHYEEEIDRAAFNKRIADVTRSRAGFSLVKCMYNHGLTIHGTPAERFSMPVAVTEHISAESKGVLTRARYLDTPLGNEVLEMWREGAITAQSFTGAIIRSTPELRRGEKYRPRSGQLMRVRRLELGLREFGATPFPAYSGAELVGVRMSPLGTYTAAGDEDEIDEQALPPDEEAAPGEPLARDDGDEHSARYHQHQLFLLESKARREKAGLVWLPDRTENPRHGDAKGAARRAAAHQGGTQADGSIRGDHRRERRQLPRHPDRTASGTRRRNQADHRADGQDPRHHPRRAGRGQPRAARRRLQRRRRRERCPPYRGRLPRLLGAVRRLPLRGPGRRPVPHGQDPRTPRPRVRRHRTRSQARQPRTGLRRERHAARPAEPGHGRPPDRRAPPDHRVRGIPGDVPGLHGRPAGHGSPSRPVPHPGQRRIPAAVRTRSSPGRLAR